MFLKTFYTLLLLLFFLPLKAQQMKLEWMAEYPDVSNTFPGFHDQRLLIDDDKNVIICFGDDNQLLATTFLFLQYDSIGDLQWELRYHEPYSSFLHGCILSETGLIFGGFSHNEPVGGTTDIILNSYDGEGQERYITTVYDPTEYTASLEALLQDSAGYLYALGYICELPCNPDFPQFLYYIAKIDPLTGEVIWEKHERSGRASKAQIIGDRMRVLGSLLMPDSSYILSLFDFDLDGNVMDSLLLFDWAGASSVLLDNNGGEMVVVDDLICSYNISGDTSWCYDYLEANPDLIGEVRKVVADEASNVYITGWLKDNANNVSYTKTVKISPDGNVLWDSKSHYTDSVSYEEGFTISLSDKYVFVGSNAYFGPDNNLVSDFRPILYSREEGDVLYDTLIHFSGTDATRNSAWDGEHFYLYGTYVSGGDPDKPLTVVLFKFGINEPVPTKEQKAISHISAFPNPFQNTFDLKIETAQIGAATITLYNTIGQRLLEKQSVLVNGENKIAISETSGWAAGVYFVSIEMNGHTYFEKIIKK